MVPNSLGPAELLLHYGHRLRKKELLTCHGPREKASKMPCFALTSPERPGLGPPGRYSRFRHRSAAVGVVKASRMSSASASRGGKALHHRWGPIAHVLLGLAFFASTIPITSSVSATIIGITLALIPTKTAGACISGAATLPLNAVFHETARTGAGDVFIPMDYIIGRPSITSGRAGRWLMELPRRPGRSILAAGERQPASPRLCALTTGRRYGRGAHPVQDCRSAASKAFRGGGSRAIGRDHLSHGKRGARDDRGRRVDLGEKPSVVSAIVKYHLTELGRQGP